MRWPAYSGETSSSWTLGVGGVVVVMPRMITIFYGIEALNHCCYSRERRQKRPGQRINGEQPALTNALDQDARPSYGAFAGYARPGVVTSAGDMRPEASLESRVQTRLLRRYSRPVHKVQSAPGMPSERFGNFAFISHDAWPPLLEFTVNANPLRILRAAAPELSGIRVGWRCTTAGLCSNRLYQDASSRPQPPVDSSS